MKRIVTITLTCTYDFEEKEYPMDKYDDDNLADIAYEWWNECGPDIFIETENED